MTDRHKEATIAEAQKVHDKLWPHQDGMSASDWHVRRNLWCKGYIYRSKQESALSAPQEGKSLNACDFVTAGNVDRIAELERIIEAYDSAETQFSGTIARLERENAELKEKQLSYDRMLSKGVYINSEKYAALISERDQLKARIAELERNTAILQDDNQTLLEDNERLILTCAKSRDKNE